jgi:hypothetical protein
MGGVSSETVTAVLCDLEVTPHVCGKNIKRKEVISMEELQNALVTKIGEQLNTEKPNIQYLDVLNRLLGTVNNCIISNK